MNICEQLNNIKRLHKKEKKITWTSRKIGLIFKARACDIGRSLGKQLIKYYWAGDNSHPLISSTSLGLNGNSLTIWFLDSFQNCCHELSSHIALPFVGRWGHRKNAKQASFNSKNESQWRKFRALSAAQVSSLASQKVVLSPVALWNWANKQKDSIWPILRMYAVKSDIHLLTK